MTGIRAAWDHGAVILRGPDLPELLAVAPVSALGLGADLIATAGTWERSGDGARFTPRFGAVPGTRYAVVGRAGDSDDLWQELARVSVPGTGLEPRTVVETIEPDSEWVPANLLRLSVTFSAAMEEGSAAGNIHLLDEAGSELRGTLLEMPPELWDRDHRRLTVLLEPGRIKRGLEPNQQAGPPLRNGDTVTVAVEVGIRDDRGAPLREGARRSYRVGPSIRSRVDPALWEVRWPERDTDPVDVRFDRPLDAALVARFLRVIDGRGIRVPGQASLDQEARRWTFTPATSVDSVRISIDTRLEDVAGNSVRRVFDRDLQRPEDDSISAAEIILSPE